VDVRDDTGGAAVTLERSWFGSASFLIASVMWRGEILVFLLSRASLPASSRNSTVRDSRTAGAPAPTALAEEAMQTAGRELQTHTSDLLFGCQRS
jgi:hypothetical protein